jgi:hypothetical protein
MPGFLTHLVVLDRAIDRLVDDREERVRDVGRTLRSNPQAAATGAIGPDVTFFMDLMPLAQVLLKAFDYYREFKERLKPLEEGVDEVARFGPDVDLLTGGVLGRIGDLFSAAFDVLIVAAERTFARESDLYRTIVPALPLQESAREREWFWFDMLHYRATGPMARELVTRAGSDGELSAYAFGYMSHVAVDAVGHAFVNSVVGAPYRCLWQRHHMVDNYIDVWAARRYWSQEMLASKVCSRYYPRAADGGSATLPRAVADLLADSTRSVFVGRSHPDGRRLEGREFPTRDDFQRTYRDLFNVLESTTADVPMKRPKRPEVPDFDLRDLLPPPPHIPGPSDYDDPAMDLLAIFLWPLYLARAAKEWVEEAVARILAMAEAPARYVILLFLYEMQMMLYHTYRAHHRALSLRGYTYGYSDDLGNHEERALWTVPRVEAHYPHREDRDLWERPWRWPDSEFERADTWPGPYLAGSTPASFIEDAVQSEEIYGRLINPRRPSDVRDAVATMRTTAAEMRPGLGNAVDLFVRMVRGTVNGDAIPNFNLDADRGYGWPCWTWRDGARGPASGTLNDGDIRFNV